MVLFFIVVWRGWHIGIGDGCCGLDVIDEIFFDVELLRPMYSFGEYGIEE